MIDTTPSESTPKPWHSYATPLLAQAVEHKGEKVVVYIAGGIRVDGKLRDVDEDTLVLTIDDATHRQYVAVESIAVLAVER